MEKKTWKNLEGKFHDRAKELSDELCACGCGNRITVRTAKARAKGTTKGYIWEHRRIGKKHSEESKRLMSLSRPDVSGEKNPNYGKGLFGEQNPNWQGGKKEKYYHGKNQPEAQRLFDRMFRTRIKNRDGHCILCGSKVVLEVHHIEPWVEREDLRFDPKNCVTLCKSCHVRSDNAHHKETMKEMLKSYIRGIYVLES